MEHRHEFMLSLINDDLLYYDFTEDLELESDNPPGVTQEHIVFYTAEDRRYFKVPRMLARCSKYMGGSMVVGDIELIKFPLELPDTIDGESFKRVLTYLVHHVHDTNTYGEKDENGFFKCTEWDKNFLSSLTGPEKTKLISEKSSFMLSSTHGCSCSGCTVLKHCPPNNFELTDSETASVCKKRIACIGAAHLLGIKPLFGLSHHTLCNRKKPRKNLEVTSGVFREINRLSLWKNSGS